MHMRFHLIQYVEDKFDLMSSILKGPFEVRGMTLPVYLKKMRTCETCGYEITLLIMTHMYKVPILIIRSDMLWLSSNVTAVDCPIVLIQNSLGQFLGTKTKYPVFVGDLPKVKLPRKHKNKKTNVIKHSMPLRKEKTSGEKFGSADEILSPIVDGSSNASIKHDHTYSLDDKDTAKLWKQVKIFAEANLSMMVDPCNTDQKDCSMSTEFPAHNMIESSIDYCDRMQISVGNDAEVNTLVMTEVNDICVVRYNSVSLI